MPLSNEQDKQHARALIEYVKRYRNSPGDPFRPPEPGYIVLAEIGWGADGINRNHLLPGKAEWPWHVAGFVGFSPYSVEIADGSPEEAHLNHFRNGYDNPGAIGFWDYTVTAELGPALCLCVAREQGALRFWWTDLSSNAAYVGANYVYTLEMREPPSQSWVPIPGGPWPTRATEWTQLIEDDGTNRLYRVRAELMDDRSWKAVARDCETVFFRVDWVRVAGGGVHSNGPSSFVVPLSKDEDKRYARALIKHLEETPQEPLPNDPGASVITAVEWGSDGINRNHLLPGKPPWRWHVKEFLGFTPYTGDLGIPRVMPEGVLPSSESLSFGAYLITAELGPALCLSTSRCADALQFQWANLSTNEAYVATNWVYTIEVSGSPSGSWVPAPSEAWPTPRTEWAQALGENRSTRFYRLRGELLEGRKLQFYSSDVSVARSAPALTMGKRR